MTAKTTGLFRRGGSYYVRVVLPLGHPLHQVYRTGRVIQAIGACSFREASRRALDRRLQLLGAPIQTLASSSAVPQQPIKQVLPAPQDLALVQVYDRWARAKKRSDDTLAACKRALEHYQRQVGDMPISAVTRAMGDEFRSWLIAQPTSTKTARDRFTWVKSLFKFAQQDLGLLHVSPWAGLDITAEAATHRRPWSEAELGTLFGHEIWSKGKLPREAKAGGPAAYWLPLLALYTGARCGELCQLRVLDVNAAAKIPTIRITEDGHGQRLKTRAAQRDIPVHSELLKLGFLSYVKRLTSDSLWPHLPQREEKPGGYFSAYFTTLRQSLGIPPEVVFHSFRHNVRTQLVEGSVSEVMIDRLLGHRPAGSVGARVYTHPSHQGLQAAIETVSYPHLFVTRVQPTAGTMTMSAP